MIQPDRLRAERAWSLLVVWLLVLILTNISPAPALAASAGEFQLAAALDLPVAGPLDHPALGDRPIDSANAPLAPANVDETERERQTDASAALDCLPSARVSFIIHSSAQARQDEERLQEYWVSHGIRDLRGPPVA